MNKEPNKNIKTFSYSNLVCFKYGKVEHFKKDCKVKKKINNLNILDKLKDILYQLMLNSSKSKSMTDLDNQYDINQLQDIEEISSKTSSDQEVLEH